MTTRRPPTSGTRIRGPTSTKYERWRPHSQPPAGRSDEWHVVSGPSQIKHFALHYAEMCIPMCIGFAVGDALYFWLAGLAGYSKPFSQLPGLSVVVVTFTMTAPMTAWMVYRGMPRRRVIEMSAVMPVFAIVLLLLGGIGVIPPSDLALTEHGLMMPAMLIPMLLGLGFYAGRSASAVGTDTATIPGRR
jgi:hypothetical protein